MVFFVTILGGIKLLKCVFLAVLGYSVVFLRFF